LREDYRVAVDFDDLTRLQATVLLSFTRNVGYDMVTALKGPNSIMK
jgi:hypothetical protein